MTQKLLAYGEFPRMMESAAHEHCVTLYAYMLHMLHEHQWSVKRIALRTGATIDSVIRVLHRCGVRLLHIPRYQLHAQALVAGYADAAEYALHLIAANGSQRAAAQAAGVRTNMLLYPIELANRCADVRLHLQVEGDTALYLPRQLCGMYGISYTHLQDLYMRYRKECEKKRAAVECFQSWSVGFFKSHGLRCKPVSILGWNRDVVTAALYRGAQKYSKRREQLRAERAGRMKIKAAKRARAEVQ